ncbi:MAG: tetratricopeptide repeat protein [Mariprofundaceae bacterium]
MSSTPNPAPLPANWQGVRNGLENAENNFRQAEYHQASQHLQEVLEFAPMEARAWHLLGRVMQAMGDHDQALQHFRNASDLYASNSSTQSHREFASIALAKLLWKQGEKESACAMLDKLMDLGENDHGIYDLRQAWEKA